MAGQVDIDDRLPILREHVVEHLVPENAGGVENDVKPAKRLARLGDHGEAIVELRDRPVIRRRVAARFFDLVHNLLRRGLVQPSPLPLVPGSLTTTLAPFAAISFATSAPTPRPAPQQIATRPSSMPILPSLLPIQLVGCCDHADICQSCRVVRGVWLMLRRSSRRRDMEDREIRAVLDRHWAASDANDFEAEHQIYREDAVLEYPQSGERIRGRRKIEASRAAQPNRKRFMVRRIIGAGDLWVTEYVLTYDGRPSYTVSIMEFLDGKVARETQYFGDPFEPGPSRAQWVERMP